MDSVSFDPSHKTLSLMKRFIPTPAADEVRIKVAFSGICGTDLHILEGEFPCKNGPLILGHEFVGTIDEIGTNVRTFKVGQRVAVNPNSGCNKCDQCHNGNYHFCKLGGLNNTLGIYRDGGWATHALVPETQAHLLPDEMSLEHAVLSEPMSCLAHGWDKLGPVHVGSRVLIMGGGIIGLLWACLFHLHGHRRTVTISEIQGQRRRLASNLGLDYQVAFPGEIEDNFDVAVDCSGSTNAMELAVSSLSHGGRLCIFGVAHPEAPLTIKPFEIYKKELSIIGVLINPFSFLKGLALLQAMSDKYIDFDKLGIKLFPLSQYKQALAALKNGEISKAIFKL